MPNAEPKKEACRRDDSATIARSRGTLIHPRWETPIHCVSRRETPGAGPRRTSARHSSGFGGGWTGSSPEKSVGWARNAAQLGMVGIAPDYRDQEPLQHLAVWSRRRADGRLCAGVEDSRRNDASTRTALSVCGTRLRWKTMSRSGRRSRPRRPAPIPTRPQRSNLWRFVLQCPVSDTSVSKGYTPKRFGENAGPFPLSRLDAKMPPTLLFHGDADQTVPYAQSVGLNKADRVGQLCGNSSRCPAGRMAS